MSTIYLHECNICDRRLHKDEQSYSISLNINGADLYADDIDICPQCASKNTIEYLKVIVAQQGEEE